MALSWHPPVPAPTHDAPAPARHHLTLQPAASGRLAAARQAPHVAALLPHAAHGQPVARPRCPAAARRPCAVLPRGRVVSHDSARQRERYGRASEALARRLVCGWRAARGWLGQGSGGKRNDIIIMHAHTPDVASHRCNDLSGPAPSTCAASHVKATSLTAPIMVANATRHTTCGTHPVHAHVAASTHRCRGCRT